MFPLLSQQNFWTFLDFVLSSFAPNRAQGDMFICSLRAYVLGAL